ncbi:UDP-glycosyltransferase 76F1-like [Aristolochia californica]|uniref:UDP-glycosyltransferase 76F1-like n=1 Tax=Aristolochia californica TaxID=171875 RepID=UPI0035E2FA79
MAGKGQSGSNGEGRRLVLFATPLQGHITPMLQLASLLHSKGFCITIIHTNFNSPDPSDYPDFSFESISDGLPTDKVSSITSDFIAFSTALNRNCEEPFRDRLKRLVSDQRSDRIACVIDDGNMQFVPAVANELKVPRILFLINSAASLAVYFSFPMLKEKGYLPIKDPQSDVPIVDFPPLRIKDIPDIGSDDPDAWFQIVAEALRKVNSSSAIFWNTYDYLEGTNLSKIKQDLQVPIFTIGPVHKYPTYCSSSLLTAERSCLAWLDQQAPASVIYVSFGSLACLEEEELVEAAWGLANSEQAFLWSLRPDSVRGSDSVELPGDFEEKTIGRGRIVKWAPQLEVLAHPSVGAFWTHCGWNSTLESICEGVPMLCWPSFGDQRVNARYVSSVWKIGLQLDNGLKRGEVERALRRIMTEKEREVLKGRAKELMANAELSLTEDGSSCRSLSGLVDHLMSL